VVTNHNQGFIVDQELAHAYIFSAKDELTLYLSSEGKSCTPIEYWGDYEFDEKDHASIELWHEDRAREINRAWGFQEEDLRAFEKANEDEIRKLLKNGARMDEKEMRELLEDANIAAAGVMAAQFQINKIELEFDPVDMDSDSCALKWNFANIGVKVEGLLDEGGNLTKEVVVGILAHEYGHVLYRREKFNQNFFDSIKKESTMEEETGDECGGFVLGHLKMDVEPFQKWLTFTQHLRSMPHYPEPSYSQEAVKRGEGKAKAGLPLVVGVGLRST